MYILDLAIESEKQPKYVNTEETQIRIAEQYVRL